MPDIIIDNCYVCGAETDAWSGDDKPRCVKCYDRGLAARWSASTDPERIAKARALYAKGDNILSISRALRASPTMVRMWCGVINKNPKKKSGLDTKSVRNTATKSLSGQSRFMEVET